MNPALPVALTALVFACLAYGLAVRANSMVHRLDAVLAPWLEFWILRLEREGCDPEKLREIRSIFAAMGKRR